MSSLAAFLLLDSDCLCNLITNLTSWHHNLLFASTCPCPSGCWRSFNQSMFDHDDMAIMVLEQHLHHCKEAQQAHLYESIVRRQDHTSGRAVRRSHAEQRLCASRTTSTTMFAIIVSFLYSLSVLLSIHS